MENVMQWEVGGIKIGWDNIFLYDFLFYFLTVDSENTENSLLYIKGDKFFVN